ncbi:MAG: CoA ester lyase [Steroidobacteraceae bacterium]|jgi:citrate lyase subunit beta/citryl-CoA lyase|nr:CoA ester lyase [Steroidobacteraceae bacterium]
MTSRRRRSVLYVPASHARAVEKTRGLPCDVVILDLEDAVAPEAKAQARAQAVAAVLAGGFGARELVVRVNGLDTPWGEADLEAVVAARPDAILVPKVARRADLRPFEARLAAAGAGPGANQGEGESAGARGIALWAMIETAASIFHLQEIAAAAAEGPLAALVVGTNDLAKEACMRLGTERRPLLGALGLVVLAARAHGLAAIDGVFNALDDAAGLEAQCAQGRDFGFDGKTLVHPSQVEPCNAAFTPDAAAVEAARRIVAAFAAAENAGQGALRVDGQMVERLHLVEARRTLAMAGVESTGTG